MSKRLITSVKKTIHAPLPFAYQWLTDYRDDDPKITGSTAVREVIEKTPNRAVYTTEMMEGGKLMKTMSVVTLRPPDRWDVEATSDLRDYTGAYRLVPSGEDTIIEMIFDSTYKIGDAPEKEGRERITNERWDMYIAALELDYKKRTG